MYNKPTQVVVDQFFYYNIYTNCHRVKFSISLIYTKSLIYIIFDKIIYKFTNYGGGK